jgi:hypothetical protein
MLPLGGVQTVNHASSNDASAAISLRHRNLSNGSIAVDTVIPRAPFGLMLLLMQFVVHVAHNNKH